MIKYTRNGRLHWLRIGRLCFSFSIARRTYHKQSVYMQYCMDVLAVARIMGA